jgi:hypothetical protein
MISGTVAVSCRVSVEGQLSGSAQATLREFCNNGAGYRVYADHSADLADASLTVAGRTIKLSDQGSTLISESPSAAIATHALSLSVPAGVQGGSLSFRIVPV